MESKYQYLRTIEAQLPEPLMKYMDDFIITAGVSIMDLADEGIELPEKVPIESWAAGLLITRALASLFGPECNCDNCTTEWVSKVLFEDDES